MPSSAMRLFSRIVPLAPKAAVLVWPAGIGGRCGVELLAAMGGGAARRKAGAVGAGFAAGVGLRATGVGFGLGTDFGLDFSDSVFSVVICYNLCSELSMFHVGK